MARTLAPLIGEIFTLDGAACAAPGMRGCVDRRVGNREEVEG